MILNTLIVDDWKQFGKIEIEFHPKLTVLTGANGAGKSSLLRLINKQFGWEYNETGTPLKNKRGYRVRKRKMDSQNVALIKVASLSLTNGSKINYQAPEELSSAMYGLSWGVEGVFQGIRGINIPSHRTPYSYRQITTIPARPRTRHEAYDLVQNSIKMRSLGNHAEMPTYFMKETLVGLAMFGQGNDFVIGDQDSLDLYLGFVDILRALLPKSLGFTNLSIRNSEVVLETKTGEFLLDSVSGGIGAVIDLAWQIYMFDSDKENPFVVLIDEAENHLHATMQRELLPNLIHAFPRAQFVVTTHSPLMVNSVRDSTVYVLDYEESEGSRRVFNYRLDFYDKTGSANQVLRDVLGVPVSIPVWVENELNVIVENFIGKDLTPEIYTEIKSRLQEIGFSDYLPQALALLNKGE